MSNAVSFDGGSFTVIASDDVINIPYVSISVWVKTTLAGAQIIGFSDGYATSTGATDKNVFITADGKLSWYVYVGSTAAIVTATVPITDGNWHHVVATYKENEQIIYFDGVQVAGISTTGSSYVGYTQINVMMGGRGGTYGTASFLGSQADFLLYDRALTAGEVAAIYAEGAVVVGSGSLYGKLAYGKGLYSRYTPLTQDLAGGLVPAVTFAADLTTFRVPVDLAGDLAPSVVFAADLTAGSNVALAGNLAPAVSLAADLTIPAATALAGDLAPSVVFAGALTAIESLAGDLAPSVTFSASLDTLGRVDLFGDFAPSVVFAADLVVTVNLSGDLSPSVIFSGALTGLAEFVGDLTPAITLSAALANLIGLVGDLAPSVVFAADLTLAGASFVDLAGDFAPVVAFSADLVIASATELAGDLAPSVTFSAELGLVIDLAGDLAPQIDLEGLLGLDAPIEGDLSFTVVLAASELISGPLWGEVEVPPSLWTPVEPCRPPIWTPDEPPLSAWAPAELCGFPPATSSYGKGAYGLNQYSAASGWQETGSTPVDWKKTELCDG